MSTHSSMSTLSQLKRFLNRRLDLQRNGGVLFDRDNQTLLMTDRRARLHTGACQAARVVVSAGALRSDVVRDERQWLYRGLQLLHGAGQGLAALCCAAAAAHTLFFCHRRCQLHKLEKYVGFGSRCINDRFMYGSVQTFCVECTGA